MQKVHMNKLVDDAPSVRSRERYQMRTYIVGMGQELELEWTDTQTKQRDRQGTDRQSYA